MASPTHPRAVLFIHAVVNHRFFANCLCIPTAACFAKIPEHGTNSILGVTKSWIRSGALQACPEVKMASGRRLRVLGSFYFIWMTGAFGLGIPSVCAGDLFWKFVDRPRVDLARWLQLLPFFALAKHASATSTQFNATVRDFHEHSYTDQTLLTDLNSSTTSPPRPSPA